jgi:hypothetical protein
MKRIVIGVCAALLLAVLSGSEASAVSPNNTTVTASGPPITDIENNVWAITSAIPSFFEIKESDGCESFSKRIECECF